MARQPWQRCVSTQEARPLADDEAAALRSLNHELYERTCPVCHTTFATKKTQVRAAHPTHNTLRTYCSRRCSSRAAYLLKKARAAEAQ